MDFYGTTFLLVAGFLACIPGAFAVSQSDVDDINALLNTELKFALDDLGALDFPVSVETQGNLLFSQVETFYDQVEISMDELETALLTSPLVLPNNWYKDLCLLIDSIDSINTSIDNIILDPWVGKADREVFTTLKDRLIVLKDKLVALKNQIDPPMTGEGDPHFLVFLGKNHHPVCFDFHGRDNDVIQLLRDDLLDVTVNGQLFETVKSTPEHIHSFLSSIAVMVEECTVVVSPEDIYINEEMMPWCERGHFRRCNGLMNLVFVNGQLKLDTGKGVALMLLKHHRPRIGNFLGIYFTDQYGLSTQSHGILGQMHYKRLLVQGDLDMYNSEGYMLFPTVDHKLPQKVIASMYRHNKVTKEHSKCWKVERDGQGLLDGQAEDYFQEDQNLYYRGLLPALKPYVK